MQFFDDFMDCSINSSTSDNYCTTDSWGCDTCSCDNDW